MKKSWHGVFVNLAVLQDVTYKLQWLNVCDPALHYSFWQECL
jgi:hypothetical protein